MYAQSAFKTHQAVALAYAAARSFGLIVACDGGRPVASPLPFRLVEKDGEIPRLQFHVARGNPLAALAEKGGTWLVAVQGPDTYISPDWYTSADQVPTWLYETVHLSGPVHVIPPEHMPAHLDALSAQFEGWLVPKPPWTMEKVSPARREMLLKLIVGMEMKVESVEGSFKLNQNKTDADNVSVVHALSRGDEAARAIAERMVALRPQLTYDQAGAKAGAEGSV